MDYALNENIRMGAYQQKLKMTINNNTIAKYNANSAESMIRDADMAKYMTEYVRNKLITQSSQSKLIYANQSANSILNLLH